jgi:hypothetical protein
MLINSFRFANNPAFLNTYSTEFDGVDDNVYLQNLTSRKVQTLTMSVWVKPTAFARDGIILNGHTSYGNEGIEIYWNFNQFAVRINGTIQGLGAGNGQNNWTHIAIAYDGNTLKRMVNGVPNTDVVIGQAIKEVLMVFILGTLMSLLFGIQTNLLILAQYME